MNLLLLANHYFGPPATDTPGGTILNRQHARTQWRTRFLPGRQKRRLTFCLAVNFVDISKSKISERTSFNYSYRTCSKSTSCVERIYIQAKTVEKLKFYFFHYFVSDTSEPRSLSRSFQKLPIGRRHSLVIILHMDNLKNELITFISSLLEMRNSEA